MDLFRRVEHQAILKICRAKGVVCITRDGARGERVGVRRWICLLGIHGGVLGDGCVTRDGRVDSFGIKMRLSWILFDD